MRIEHTTSPSFFLNASAVGYYGNVPEDEVTEEYLKRRRISSGCLGEQWEMEARRFKSSVFVSFASEWNYPG